MFGIGTSSPVASYLCLYLLRLGISVSFVQDPLHCAVSAVNLTENDLFISISSSGRTKDVLDAAKYAKSVGASVVAMTSAKDAPILKLADDVLFSAASGKAKVSKESEITFSQLALCETLCVYLSSRIDGSSKTGENGFYKIREIINLHSVND